MKTTKGQEEFEQIETYLIGKLDEEKGLSFEKKLKTDKEFSDKVEKIRKSINLIKESAIEHTVVDTLKNLQREARNLNATTTYKYKFPGRIVLRNVLSGSLAASVILMIYLSLAPVHFPDTENDFNITRGIDSTQFTSEQRAAFSNFFDGQAHLVEGRYWLAVKDFQKSLEVKNIRPYFREAAEWHLLLAYVKSNQPDKAEAIYKKFKYCNNCEYPIDKFNRWKLWWQILWTKMI